jgi:hypothetical protein
MSERVTHLVLHRDPSGRHEHQQWKYDAPMAHCRGVFAVLLIACARIADAQGVTSEPPALQPHERAALLQLFNSTNGDQWRNRAGWGGPFGTECDWYGVVCDYAAPVVTVQALFLGENNLTGTLPNSLGALTNLSELLLYGNHLTGPLPARLLERFDDGRLRLLGYAGQFSPIVEVRLNVAPSSVLCGDYNITLKVDGPDKAERKMCRNARPGDRSTYWERQVGRVGVYAGDIDRIARLIETMDFSSLETSYWRNVTHATFETVTVIYRDGTSKSVRDYAEAAPKPMWLIKRAIAGAAFNGDWETVSRSKPMKE